MKFELFAAAIKLKFELFTAAIKLIFLITFINLILFLIEAMIISRLSLQGQFSFSEYKCKVWIFGNNFEFELVKEIGLYLNNLEIS